MKKTFFLLAITVSFLMSSCFKDQDDTAMAASTEEIQNFIYRGLNIFYLYKADTPELADDAFTTQGDLNTFLSNYATPEALFDYLKSSQDRFSFLVYDYIALENALNGISLSNGMEFGLVRYPDESNNVFGYVRYILPNSDASQTTLQRGTIFTTINGQQIVGTPQPDGSLAVDASIFSPTTYTIGLADFDGESITPNGQSVELTKQQYIENPVFLSNTLTIEGQKIGYLMYNGFNKNFDSELNNAFGQFVADGVTNLVLDLRYNGGGSVETAVDLASMITGQFNGQTLYTEEWNAERQEEFAENGVFDNTISNGEAINSLNLNTVYILTSARTASASELVINTLSPYINVVQIGDVTTGKYQASFTLYDAPDFSRAEANPNHTYAMQPLVFKTKNINGFPNDAQDDEGLTPTVALQEDYSNLGILGTETEPLLAAALNEIFPGRNPVKQDFKKLKEVADSKTNSPAYQIMVAND